MLFFSRAYFNKHLNLEYGWVVNQKKLIFFSVIS